MWYCHPTREGTIFLDKYYPMLQKDTADCEEALAQKLPDVVRNGLEDELKRLRALSAALSGESDKSELHQLRAKLRWGRARLAEEKDASKRRKMEADLTALENEIHRAVERQDRNRG
jgi:hypothetical protein